MNKTNRRNRASRNRISKMIGWNPEGNGLEERVLLASYVVMNSSSSGTGSLSEAIDLANASPGDDTILFDNSVFSRNQTIYNDSYNYWLPTVKDVNGGKLSIQGPKTSILTIYDNSWSAFYIKTPCEISDITLNMSPTQDTNNNYATRSMANYGTNYLFCSIQNKSDLQLNNFTLKAFSGTFDYFATGILNTSSGNLTVNNSSISGFRVYTSSSNTVGSGIWNEGIALVNGTKIDGCYGQGGAQIINSNIISVDQSTLSGIGNGIENFGNANISETQISASKRGVYNNSTMNFIRSEISGSSSGAILNGSNGLLTAIGSSLWNNIAASDGIAINNKSELGLSLINCTVSNNNCTTLASILNDTGAKMSINSSTIAGNSAGIKAISSVLVSSSIISNTAYDINGPVTSNSWYNLVANGTGLTGIANGTSGNRIGTSSSKIDPKLQSLGYYGGLTKTLALQALSPAIDNGGTQNALTNNINNSATSFVITNPSLLGCTSGLMIPVQVDNEIMMVISSSSANSTITVIRGALGTQVASHNIGAKVYLLNDQRSLTRSSIPDVGAFESKSYIISVTSGNNQTQTVNTVFATVIKVKVTDPLGLPIAGVSVSFSAPAIGASCNFLTSDIGITDASGFASPGVVIANKVAGSYSLIASVSSIGAVTFNETNKADIFSVVTPYPTEEATYVVGNKYNPGVYARTTDQFGNPVSNISVKFTVPPAKGANCTLSDTSNVISDSNGLAYSSYLSTNTITGTYQLIASSGTSSPAVFSLTNIADVPYYLTTVSGANQTTPIGTDFTTPIVIALMDRYDNRSYKSGVSMTYSVPNTGATGSFSSSLPVITDTNGLATLPKLTANYRTGYYIISVVAPSLLAGYLDIRVGNGLISPISVTNTNDSGTGSLRDAIGIAASEPGDDKIIFTGSSFNANATITLNSTLYINDTSGKVSITGTGMKTLVISGNNKCTVFAVNSPAAFYNLAIDSGNFANSSYWSGGINSYSGLEIANVSFTNCVGNVGGAVYSGFDILYGLTQVNLPLSITDCIFSNNTARNGGAVCRYTFSDEVGIVSNSTFSQNSGSFGGAIENIESQLLVSNCSFSENHAFYGGAIMSTSSRRSSSIVLTSSYLFKNSSRYSGGTIYNEVSGSSFMGKTFNGMSSISISDSIISNSTSTDGGSIGNFSGGSPLTSYANITLLNSKIINSQATNKGGAIYNMFYSNTTGVLVIDNSTLANSSSGSGGAIFIKALNGIQGFFTNITNSSFSFNNSSLQGGAISNFDNSIINISKSTFAYNSSANGGVIYNDLTNPNSTPTLILNSATFAFNSADHGGAILNAAGNISILNSIIANNTSSDGPDIKGNIATANYSLIGDPSQSNILKGSQNIFGNPKLGNLGFYGGPTQTLPLLKGRLDPSRKHFD